MTSIIAPDEMGRTLRLLAQALVAVERRDLAPGAWRREVVRFVPQHLEWFGGLLDAERVN